MRACLACFFEHRNRQWLASPGFLQLRETQCRREAGRTAAEYRKAAKALSELEPLVQKFREYKRVEQEIAGAEELVKGSDVDMRALAQEELTTKLAERDTVEAV